MPHLTLEYIFKLISRVVSLRLIEFAARTRHLIGKAYGRRPQKPVRVWRLCPPLQKEALKRFTGSIPRSATLKVNLILMFPI